MRIPDRAREAAIRASDLAFRRRHGLTRADGWPYRTRALNPEEAENAELEDDDEADEAEERDPARSRARDAS